MTIRMIESFGLSPLQAHLAHLGLENTPACSARIRIQGPLEAEQLRQALQLVAEHHEILRTHFPILPGTHAPVQAIGESIGLLLEEHELEDPEPNALDEIEEALTAEPFALGECANLRAALLHFSAAEHLLILAQNPLSSDATSLWNLTRCLAAALAGERLPGFETRDAQLADEEDPAAPLQMADVAQWFNDNFESDEARSGQEYWSSLNQLEAGFKLPLSSDRGGRKFAPEACSREWSATDEDELQRFAKSQGLPADTILAATWTLLLSRLSGSDALICGLTSDGRAFDGLPDALGPFARLLPLSVRVDRHASAAEFLRQFEGLRQTTEQNYETFDYRRAGWNPEVPLAYGCAFHGPLAALEQGKLRLSLDARRCLSEPFELFLELDRGVGEPELCLYFDRRKLDGADASVMLEQFDGLLAAVMQDASQTLQRLPWLSDGARADLLLEYAPGEPLAPATRCVHELFSEQARLHPKRIALRASNGSLSYAELETSSNRLAHQLRGLGIGAGDFVGLYFNRCVEQVVAIMGVFKSGAAYLPLPPDYPAERIAFMLADTGARVLITCREERKGLGAFGGHVISLDDCAELAAFPSTAPEPVLGLEHDAYVIFTSGSTGQPKGVPISHSNLAHSTMARLQAYEHPVACYMLLSSFAFDSSVAGLYWALSQGGCLALPPDGFEEDIASLAALFHEWSVSHTLALPSLWNMLLDAAQPGQLESLCTVIVAGESSSRDLLARHLQALPDCELINEYGPTEGTVWSSYFDCSQDFERANVPIGRPIPGASIFIVNDQLELLPVGHAGELLISGPGVARGYLGRPELSAERFVTTDFGDGAVRCYRSGDLARFLPAGDLEFLGRIDHQVKIRGYRIELEEIEARLLKQSAIQEALVIAREDTPGDKRLVAYLCMKKEAGQVDPKAMRALLAQDLPDYMLPAHFVILEHLPQLPNGKLDRSNLPAPDHGRSLSSVAYSAPSTPLEKVLVALFADVLQQAEVGADDDFFELGGHSILATRLFARLVDVLQASISLRAIFDARTPRALANLMLSDAEECERLELSAQVVLEVLEMQAD